MLAAEPDAFPPGLVLTGVMSQPSREDHTDSGRTAPPLRPNEPLWREVAGEQLRDIRRSRGETLQQVAWRARVSPQYLSEIERGTKEPSSEILRAIAQSLETTLLDLTEGIAQRLHSTAAAGSTNGHTSFTLAA